MRQIATSPRSHAAPLSLLAAYFALELSIDPNDKTPHQHQRLNDDLKNEAYRAAISALVVVPSP